MEIHEGAGGNHSGGRALALRIKKRDHYWPTMMSDCEKYVAKYEKCQRHAPIIHQSTELLRAGIAPYPFMRWTIDIIGLLAASRQKRYILVLTDYFTKWVEAESYTNIKAKDVQLFVWKYIICRHGLPYEILTDNGSQFISLQFEDFCAKLRIKLRKSTPRCQERCLHRRARRGALVLPYDPRQATNETPFFLAYGMEAMAPAEVGSTSLRQKMLVQDSALNSQMLLDRLDELEEERDKALLRIQNYQTRPSTTTRRSTIDTLTKEILSFGRSLKIPPSQTPERWGLTGRVHIRCPSSSTPACTSS
ncbi:PREDICTED: uncharacterized protein LOC109128021 [Camelina sativa]|uniref:Uncharacterized protein LOC109128021 n=1 Tax=Camelina sativa TaxID=90675 RepID=A0ABM1QR42_CAMSA|nr:PREDICTED: uncharacterized protein LOC109128021 [Camelina sativa]